MFTQTLNSIIARQQKNFLLTRVISSKLNVTYYVLFLTNKKSMSCHIFILSVISAISYAVIMGLTPRSDIFSDESYIDLALSPCGKYVTFVAPDEKGVKNIFLHEVFVSANGKQKQITFEDIDITCKLSSLSILICRKFSIFMDWCSKYHHIHY